MSEKKYYWLKVNEHFFEDERIQYIESQENGNEYIYFWIKLLLKCLKNKTSGDYGFLRFTDKIPYDDKLLSKLTNTKIDTVRVAMKYFQDLEMIKILDDKTIYVESVNNMIGSETDAAIRVRKHRNKIEMLQCNKNVTELLCNEETEKDIYIDKEIDKEEIDTPLIPYSEIVNILNAETGNNYKHTSKSTRNFIKARWNEGFRFSDFEKVIKAKCSQWKADPKMSIYLRPQTLFGTKFESYLQEYGKVTEGRKLKEYEKDYDAKYAGKDIFKTI